MSRLDTDAIRAGYSVSSMVERAGIKLRRDGREFKGCCPFHNERTPSFHVVDDKEFYHCFGCGAHGDVVDFVMAFYGVPFKEACAIITGNEGPMDAQQRTRRESVAADVYAGLKAKPTLGGLTAGKRTPPIFNPKRADDEKKRTVTYTPSMVFPYLSATGELLGYVLRVEFDDAKITPTIRYAQLPDGTEGWTHWHFDEPRPLYGLDKLAAAPSSQVFICEGEKAADACARLLGVVAITWPGGTNAVDKADWSPLQGRKVVIWPDADAPGWDAMQRIAAVLQGIAAEVKIIDPRDQPLKGWDAADAEQEGMTRAEALAWGKARISVWAASVEPEPEKPKQVIKTAEKPPTELANTRETKPKATVIKPTQQEQPKLKVVEKPAKPPEPNKQHPDFWRNRIICKEDGGAKPRSVENALLTIEHHEALKGMLVYDAFADMVMLMRRPPWERDTGTWTPRPIRDDDSVACAGWLERGEAGGLTINPPLLRQCLVRVAKKNEVDPAKDWLSALTWDGTERINHWLSDHCGSAENAYTQTVGRKFLIGAVKRVMEPGCKVDAMLILEGPQGFLKSTALRLLFTWGERSYFTDQVDDISHKDALMQIQGVAGIEFAEMDTLNKADTDNIKKFITRQIDRYRPPYGTNLVDRPRRCVFAGTVNPGGNGYLKDPTGARRFWPVQVCRNIDIAELTKAVPQLWAEAVAAWRGGEKCWIDDPAVLGMARDEQSARYEDDPWAAALDTALRYVDAITMAELMTKLAIPTERQDRRASARIAAHLRHRGWENRKDYRPNGLGSPQRRFYSPNPAPATPIEDQEELPYNDND